MVKFVGSTELPLSIVDNKHFTTYVKEYLQTRYARIGRNTLRSDTIYYFLGPKNQIILDLQKYGGVISFTSYLMECINKKKGYIVATVHYINTLWVIHKKKKKKNYRF